ncbi:MAG: ABC transporter permease [Anaerolineales bacterium]|nr:ABC transporter permease [Anaerolineales bacterium]
MAVRARGRMVSPASDALSFGSGVRSMARQLTRRPVALAAALVVLALMLTALLADRLAPYDPNAQDLRARLAGPSAEHWLGTDELGRDEFSRILWGGRTSLVIGGASVLLATLAGVFLGLIAGYFGGATEQILLLLVEALMAFPGILIALAIVTVLGSGLNNVILAVAIYTIPTFIRLVRASTLQVKTEDYVLAAQALGASHAWIIFRHVLPNVVGPVIVQASLSAGTAILTGASLSFLGIGLQPPAAEWGLMMSTARLYMRLSPHVLVFPGLAIMVTVLAFNTLGDALRDILDPAERS